VFVVQVAVAPVPREQQEHQVNNQVNQALEQLILFTNYADATTVVIARSISYHAHSATTATEDTCRAITIPHQ
jgi:uncharacterized protein YfaT (DUF1175 family)